MNEVVDVVVDDGQPVSEALNEENFIQPALSSSEKNCIMFERLWPTRYWWWWFSFRIFIYGCQCPIFSHEWVYQMPKMWIFYWIKVADGMDGIGKQGLAIPIKIFCRSLSCKWNYIFYSSTLVGGAEASRSRGPKSFDINISSQIDFRKIGRGHDSIETWLSM